MTFKVRKPGSKLLRISTILLLFILKGAFPKAAYAFVPSPGTSSLDACARQPQCASVLSTELALAVATPTASGVSATITSTTATGASTTTQAAAGVAVVGDMRLSGIAAYYIWSRGVNGQAQEIARQRYCAAYPTDSVCTPFTGGQSPVYYYVYAVRNGVEYVLHWTDQYDTPLRVLGPITNIVPNGSWGRYGQTYGHEYLVYDANRNLVGNKPLISKEYTFEPIGTVPNPPTIARRVDGQPDRSGNPPPLPWKDWSQEKRSIAVAALTDSDWQGLITSMPEVGRLLPGDKASAPSGIVIPGEETDDPITPQDDRLPRKERGFFTIPLDDFDLDGKPDDSDTDDDNDGLPDTSDPGSKSPVVPMASDDDDSLVSEPGEPENGTPEHKAERWAEYQERGGTWDYERWSKTYDQNMVRARNANAAVDTYHDEIGWGEREVTVDAGGERRRLDIADEAARRGVEYKTGYITRSPEINSEVRRDAILVEQGWEMEWVFQGRASEPLLEDLRNAGIGYRFREP